MFLLKSIGYEWANKIYETYILFYSLGECFNYNTG